MNVHTVEISRLLGPDLVRQLCRRQNWFQFESCYRRNRGWVNIVDFVNGSSIQGFVQRSACLESEMYPVDGIQQVTLLRNPSKPGYFYFVVVVNLESLCRYDATVESFCITEDRLQRCCEAFSAVMGDFSDLQDKPLLEWSTRRIDYAVDVRYPGLAPLYIALAKRGRIPRGFVEEQQYAGSYYLKSVHDDIRMNFYDKEAQLRNDLYLHDDDRLIREAHGLVRFEVQCMDRKLDHIRDMIRRRHLPYFGMQLRTFLNPEIANAVVQDYYSKAIGYLDYYKIDSIQQHLQELSGRRDLKERLLHFIRQVEQTGSVTAAIAAFIQGVTPDGSPVLISGPASSLQNLLNNYPTRFGINLVTIPAAVQQSFLPNAMPVDLRISR